MLAACAWLSNYVFKTSGVNYGIYDTLHQAYRTIFHYIVDHEHETWPAIG